MNQGSCSTLRTEQSSIPSPAHSEEEEDCQEKQERDQVNQGIKQYESEKKELRQGSGVIQYVAAKEKH